MSGYYIHIRSDVASPLLSAVTANAFMQLNSVKDLYQAHKSSNFLSGLSSHLGKMLLERAA